MLLTLTKQEPILVIEGGLQKTIEQYAWEMRELLVTYKIPRDHWHRVWCDTSEDDVALKELSDDLDAQRIIGFFSGVAMALGTEEWKLVTL